jgi:hypothetical protein
MSWKTFADAAPELAAFGKGRFESGVAYLATVRKDGSPRVHPVTPIVSEEHLFVFMEPTSPKGHDLRRDGRYAIHNGVPDSSGTGGEFIITGRATFIEDPELRKVAVEASSYKPAERYILFELSVETASSTFYEESGPVRQHWRADDNATNA